MSTFQQLTDQVLLNLQGDSLDQNEQTFLTGSILSTDTTFQVDEPTLISQGMIEIGDELIWVKNVDNATGVVTTTTVGRGFRSTVATSHSAGVTVTNNPRYSRFRVKQAITTALQNVYPDLYVLKTYEFSYVGARYAYEIPVDVDQIHSISWQTIGPSRVWLPIRDYEYIPDADTTAFTTGKAIFLWSDVMPGRTVRVTYLAPPTPMVNDSDSFTSVTGLAVTAEETIVYGACYRLVGFTEAPRLQISAVEATQRSDAVPVGAGINAGKFFYAMYQECLSQERERLLRINRNSVHRIRRIM
jgi:hypothetical protein